MSEYDNIVLQLLNQPGNNNCADCGAEGPEYTSFNLGIFICTTCSAFHQKLGTHVSKVKSIRLGKWTDDQAFAMTSIGNNVAKKKYEKYVPSFYRRPIPDDPPILLEQWIRGKYERLEFIHVDKQNYNKGSMEDTLHVKKRKDGTYSPKLFVLSEETNLLNIYSKEDAKEPKIAIPLLRLNVSLSPRKMNLENSMQLSFVDDGITRNVFVMHQKGETIIDWYMAIRHAKLIALMRAYPSTPEKELLPFLTNDFLMEGWMSKTGPSENDAYRRRWVTLDNRKLMYHLHPLDETPRGEFFLGTKEENYAVREGATINTKDMGFVFSLVTPDRTYVFSVATSVERTRWMTVIERILDTPLGPLDIQCKNLLEPGKRRASRHSWFMF